MKVLISTDIEGVAGVYHPEQTRQGNPEYERARLLMAQGPTRPSPAHSMRAPPRCW